MQLDRHIESVRAGVQQAAALADEQSQDVARRLGAAIESSVRLALIESLSEAATEITADLAPGSVEFRLSDGEPQFVVTAPEPVTVTAAPEPSPEPALTAGEDEEQVRVTLRLPASVKQRVDERADADGVSTNAWLLQLVLRNLRASSAKNNINTFLNETVENAMEGAMGGWQQTPPPFPPGFPFQSDAQEGRKRNRNRQYRGWAQ